MWSAKLPQVAVGTFRPLALASLVVDWHLWHGHAWGFHLTSIVLHALTTVLLFLFFEAIFSSGTGTGTWRRAGALALIVAFHPANVEAAVWINGRSELWALLGGAGALVALTRGKAGSAAQAALVGCSLLVSLCGKETGIIFVPLTLVLMCARRDASAAQ